MDIERDRLYSFITDNSIETLKDVLTYGLRMNDNGEANGIWFSLGHLFYGVQHGGILVSLPYTDEVRDMFKFDKYDWENHASILVAHTDIPFDYLRLEGCNIGEIIRPNGKKDVMNAFKDSIRFDKATYDNYKHFNRDMEFTIYEDVYEKLFEESIDPIEKEKILENLPNFKFVKVLDGMNENKSLLKKIIITESQYNLLVENSLDKKVNALIKNYYSLNDFDEIRDKRAELLNIFPNARMDGGKYMYAVLKMYFEANEAFWIKTALNSILKLIQLHPELCVGENAFLLEKDFGNHTAKEIFNAYSNIAKSLRSDNIGRKDTIEKKRIINGYTIYRVESQNEAYELGHQEWCILIDMYYDMVSENETCYIVFNNSTYENATETIASDLYNKLEQMDKAYLIEDLFDDDIEDSISWLDEENDLGFELTDNQCFEYFDFARNHKDLGLLPYDEYGLSAFVVLVDGKGNSFYVYSRYNLSDGEDGNFLDADELTDLLGKPFKEVFPYVPHDEVYYQEEEHAL